MACDTMRQPNQTKAQRAAEIAAALEALKRALATKAVKVTVDKATGAVAFTGWAEKDRAGVSDVCAFRKLTVAGSFELRKAVASAELAAGRKVNQAAVSAGVHSHDGGRTFGPGHK